jgi:AmmeMemoRadiSam system protein B
MADPLPRLRMDLDMMPSPLADRPGLLIRDPFHYSDATLIIPPVLVACLERFDGEQTELELRETLVRLTGQLDVSDIAHHLHETLSRAGFLEDDAYGELKDTAKRQFAESGNREAQHAGSGYPDDAGRLSELVNGYFSRAGAGSPIKGPLVGIAAPHVSPEGGWESYAAAYAGLPTDDRERVFVVLGTSHYGEPDRFGLTRKPFVTPYGKARTATDLVDRLSAAAPDSILMEDYCHAVEHSIEFQVVFLQHVFGPDIRILPILCGSFANSLYGGGGLPEVTETVRRFFGALGDLYAREGSRLFFVLGIDMAHIGRRYGDSFTARAGAGKMQEIEVRDQERLSTIAAGDAGAFWDLVQPNGDELKWCGSSPLYTFLKTVPSVRGELLRYQQWNIDEQSVVSFGALTFRNPSTALRL